MGAFKRREVVGADARRRPVRLGSLAERGLDVQCLCNRCGHRAILASADLVPRLGPDIAVPEIGTRLRCSGCGGKDVATRSGPGLRRPAIASVSHG